MADGSERLEEGIRVQEVPRCILCGDPGASLYSGLRDRLFEAPGFWSLRCCAACRLAWLDPRPAPQDVGKLYARYLTHGAGERDLDLARAALAASLGVEPQAAGPAQRLWGRLLSRLPFWRDLCVGQALGCGHLLKGLPRGRLLEVGCGDGSSLSLMRDLGWEAFGVEPDPVAAQAARRVHGLEVFTGTLEEARLPERSCDAVVLHHVLEHVPDPAALLTECRRVLKESGRLALMTPNLDGLGHRLFSKSWFALDPPRHLFLFAPRALERLARQSGLRVTALGTSARLALAGFVGSWMIRTRGSFDMSTPCLAAALPALAGLAYQALQHALCACGAHGGDDIVLTASRAPEERA